MDPCVMERQRYRTGLLIRTGTAVGLPDAKEAVTRVFRSSARISAILFLLGQREVSGEQLLTVETFHGQLHHEAQTRVAGLSLTIDSTTVHYCCIIRI